MHEHQDRHRAGGIARRSHQQEVRDEEQRRDQRRQPGEQPFRPRAEPGHGRPGRRGPGHSQHGEQRVGPEGEFAERRGNGECRPADGGEHHVGRQRHGRGGQARGHHPPVRRGGRSGGGRVPVGRDARWARETS